MNATTFRLVIVMDRSFYIRRIDSDAVRAQYHAMNLVTNGEVLDLWSRRSRLAKEFKYTKISCKLFYYHNKIT